MKKLLTAVLVMAAVGGGVAAALALTGGREPRAPEVSTLKVKQPTQTVTEQDTVTVDPGTLTVEEQEDDDVEQIEAAVTTSYPGVDESSIDDVKVDGNNATATLTDGREVSLQQRDGNWEPQQIERPQPDGGRRADQSADPPTEQDRSSR